MQMIYVILLNWNGCQDTLKCIASLKKSDYNNFKIVVVDNGSFDDSCLQISLKYPEITLIQNRQNLGFAEGNNVGIRYALDAGAEGILLLNNDTTVDPMMLRHFAMSSLQNPSSILGAKILRMDKSDYLDHFGGKWNSKKFHFDLVGFMQQDDPTLSVPEDLDYVCGCALFAKSEIFLTVGLLDPRFFLYWEESDLCQRAKKLGYSIKVCEKAHLLHKGSASISGGKPHISYYWWRNRLLFIEKQLNFNQKVKFYLFVFSLEITKLLRHYLLTFLQMKLNKKNILKYEQKKDQLARLNASISGCLHYFNRRFFEGPAWISRKPSSK